MTAKYADTIKRARALIVKKGTTVTWQKAPVLIDDGTNPTPEFPVTTPSPILYKVPMAFYPLNRATLSTVVFDPAIDIGKVLWASVMPGDVPFTPEFGDIVKFDDGSTHQLVYLNRIAPDLGDVCYEVYLT